MAQADLTGTVSLNDRQWRRAIRSMAQQAREFSRNASSSFRNIKDSFRGFGRNAFSALLSGLSAINPIALGVTAALAPIAVILAGAAAAAAAFGATLSAIKGSVTVAADFEQTQIAFETLIGDAQEAQRTLDELGAFAASTPFEFTELADAGRKLIAFGEDAGTVTDTLRTIGDIASGIGAPIGEIAEIYGKARTQGRLFAEDINQLTGRGIPIIQELANQFGVAESAVKKLVESGQVNFQNLEQAFQSLTSEGGKFGGLLAAQSQSFNGLLSTARDNVTRLQLAFGTPIRDALKPILEGAIANIQSLLPLARQLGAVLGNSIERLTPAIQRFGAVAIAKIQEVAAFIVGAFRNPLDFLEIRILRIGELALDGISNSLRATARLLDFVANGLTRAIANPLEKGRQLFESFGGIVRNALRGEIDTSQIRSFGDLIQRIKREGEEGNLFGSLLEVPAGALDELSADLRRQRLEIESRIIIDGQEALNGAAALNESAAALSSGSQDVSASADSILNAARELSGSRLSPVTGDSRGEVFEGLNRLNDPSFFSGLERTIDLQRTAGRTENELIGDRVQGFVRSLNSAGELVVRETRDAVFGRDIVSAGQIEAGGDGVVGIGALGRGGVTEITTALARQSRATVSAIETTAQDTENALIPDIPIPPRLDSTALTADELRAITAIPALASRVIDRPVGEITGPVEVRDQDVTVNVDGLDRISDVVNRLDAVCNKLETIGENTYNTNRSVEELGRPC